MDVELLQIALYAEVADEVGGVCLEVLERQLVNIDVPMQQWQQLDAGNKGLHIGDGVGNVPYRVVGMIHAEVGDFKVKGKAQRHAAYRDAVARLPGGVACNLMGKPVLYWRYIKQNRQKKECDYRRSDNNSQGF